METTQAAARCVLCPRADAYGRPLEQHWAVAGWRCCRSCRATRLERPLEVIPQQHALLDATPGAAPSGPRVHGTDAPIGVRPDVLSLMSPASTGNGMVTGPAADQIGRPSAAATLDHWVQEWRRWRGQNETRPLPTVTHLCEWLEHRLDWAVAEHTSLDLFAADLAGLAAALRAANGDVVARPEHKDGIECPRCDRKTLYETTDWVECSRDRRGCGRRYKPSEYAQWVRLKDYHLRASTPCPDCGTEALMGSADLGRVECVRAKDGCGHTLTWRQYEAHAIRVHRPEKGAA